MTAIEIDSITKLQGVKSVGIIDEPIALQFKAGTITIMVITIIVYKVGYIDIVKYIKFVRFNIMLIAVFVRVLQRISFIVGQLYPR